MISLKSSGEADGGILINITKVGEGIDIPSLDAVLFADEMDFWRSVSSRAHYVHVASIRIIWTKSHLLSSR